MSAGFKSDYLDINGLHMYYEVHGHGTPLVLIHGGMLTIDLSFGGLIPELAKTFQIIAIEVQGHGRTADIDREITPQNTAGDIIGLLDHLGIAKAHIAGHSMGGAVALEMGISYPDRVLSLVPMSATVRPDGVHEDLIDPAKQATSSRMPTQQDFKDFTDAYKALSPHPEQFDAFLQKLSGSNADIKGWDDAQLASITAPTLLVIGDHDFTTIEHVGFMLEHITGSQLAVLPGTTHMQVTRRADILLPMLTKFLG